MIAEPPPSKQVHRALLGNQIADALRRDILLGRIGPGTRLGQHQLCDRFGTSRMPIRDALRALTAEGLVTVDGGQHVLVTGLDKAELLDAFLIEGMLHGLAARRVVDLAATAHLDTLQQMHDRMVVAAREENHSEVVDLNWQFHRFINKLAGSRKLIAALRSVALYLPRDYLAQIPDWIGKANDDHASFLAAVRAKNRDRAARVMSEHVTQAGQHLIAYLEAQGFRLER